MRQTLRDKVLRYVNDNPMATMGQVAAHVSGNCFSIGSTISVLMRLGLLASTGPKRFRKYSITPKGQRYLKGDEEEATLPPIAVVSRRSRPDAHAEEPSALEALSDAELDLTQAEQRLEVARRIVTNEFKEALVNLYNRYGLRVCCGAGLEVAIEPMRGVATVENQFDHLDHQERS